MGLAAARSAASTPAYAELSPGALQCRGFFVLSLGMDIKVELVGEEIVVTRPGTDFVLGYKKNPDSPNLFLTRSWVAPTVSSPTISEFRAKAFQAAVSKARELGWIV
jgi:hypothetical protein